MYLLPLIKWCLAQRCTDSSLPLWLRILWVHKLCTLCSSPLKGHTRDSCRKKHSGWIRSAISLLFFLSSCLLCPWLHLSFPLPLFSFLLLLHFRLSTHQFLTFTLSLYFLYLQISHSLKLISLPALALPLSVCLSPLYTHCCVRLILLAPNAPCSTRSS